MLTNACLSKVTFKHCNQCQTHWSSVILFACQPQWLKPIERLFRAIGGRGSKNDIWLFLTLFWLGFFMYVKWLGRGKITPLSKIFKKDAIKLKFTPQIIRSFRKSQKNSFSPNIFDNVSNFWLKMANLGMIFKIL